MGSNQMRAFLQRHNMAPADARASAPDFAQAIAELKTFVQTLNFLPSSRFEASAEINLFDLSGIIEIDDLGELDRHA